MTTPDISDIESNTRKITPRIIDVAPSAPHAAPIVSKTITHDVRISFTADEQFFKLMCQAQAAMRHKYPSGRLDGIFRDALQALLKIKTPWAFRSAKR